MRGDLQKPGTVTLLVRSHFSKLGDPGATCTSAVLNRDATISSRAFHHGTQTMAFERLSETFLCFVHLRLLQHSLPIIPTIFGIWRQRVLLLYASSTAMGLRFYVLSSSVALKFHLVLMVVAWRA